MVPREVAEDQQRLFEVLYVMFHRNVGRLAEPDPAVKCQQALLFHIVAIRNATDATESPNMKAAAPIPLKSPTSRWETMAPMK
jgi:hypothetical protein